MAVTISIAPCGDHPHGADGTAITQPSSTLQEQPARINADIQRLLKDLQNGPRPRRELEAALRVKRSVLLKRFLVPALKMGLIEKTEQGSSPNQRYKLVPAAKTPETKQASTGSSTGLLDPVSAELNEPGKQAEPQGNGILLSETPPLACERTHEINLARYHRWTEAERALIDFFRVERHLRSMFATNGWKHFGIVAKMDPAVIPYASVMVDPQLWGRTGGVTLSIMEYDANGQPHPKVIGESNLLALLARIPSLDLNVCSPTECAEMMSLAPIISPAELYLMHYYGQYFDIPHGLDKPYHGKGTALLPVAVDPFVATPFPRVIFHGKVGAVQFQLAYVDMGDRGLFLPIKYYASATNPTSFCMMPEVPEDPVLLNSDVIMANPDAEIILTDEIGIPLVNASNGSYIFSTWYGGIEVIDKLDFELLHGHSVRWLCLDSREGTVKMYEKAVKVGTIFQKHGLKTAFQFFDGVSWWSRNAFGIEAGSYKTSRILSLTELKAEASKYGIGSAESPVAANLRVLSMDELLKIKPEDYVLYPVMKPGFYCVIFGGSGVSKTWGALHIAVSLSQGQAPFKHWEYRATAPCNVLYVAGEMRESEYGDRLRKLLADQKANPHFGLIRADLDLTTEEDQETILKAVKEQKSRVVVLDNLSTLATNGHTEGKFGKVLGFIRKLQAAGIIVLLVHHENREGGFKGSGKIVLVADLALHLFSAGKGDKVEFLMRAEKVRTTSKAEQISFHVVFDPSSPKAIWETKKLTPEERRRLDEDDPLGEVEQNIGKKRNDKRIAWSFLNDDERAVAIIDGMLSGCLDDVIAADLAVREIVISDFKQQYGISKEAIQQILPVAKTSVKNLKENYTSEMLAKKVWNLLKNNDNKNK